MKYVKTSKRLLRAAKQSTIRQVRKAIKYQFGYQLPRNYEDALRLDMENGNHKWQDAMNVEMAQIKEYGVFKGYGKAKWEGKTIINAPSGYQKIRVHFCFAVKQCGKFKGRLVADGHLTKEPIKTVCSQELFLSEDSDWLCSLLNSTNSSYGKRCWQCFP